MKRQIVYLSYKETLDKARILKESETTCFKCFRMYDNTDGALHMQGTMEELEAYAKENPDCYNVYECIALNSLDRTNFIWDKWYKKEINTQPKVVLPIENESPEETTNDFLDDWGKKLGPLRKRGAK